MVSLVLDKKIPIYNITSTLACKNHVLPIGMKFIWQKRLSFDLVVLYLDPLSEINGASKLQLLQAQQSEFVLFVKVVCVLVLKDTYLIVNVTIFELQNLLARDDLSNTRLKSVTCLKQLLWKLGFLVDYFKTATVDHLLETWHQEVIKILYKLVL